MQTGRNYTGELDLLAISTLLALCEPETQLDLAMSPTALQQSFADPRLDTARDLRLWEKPTPAGPQLVGFSRLDIRVGEDDVDSLLWWVVHPDERASHLPLHIINWGTERMRTASHEYRLPALLVSPTHDSDHWRIKLFEQHGFTPIRYFLRMERPLDDTLTAPQLPPEYTIQPAANYALPDRVELFNSAFQDHWNHHPLTVTTLEHIMQEDAYHPDLDLVVAAPDGQIVAFCYAEMKFDPDQRPIDAEIQVLGTLRAYRKQSIAKALLFESMRRLKQYGLTRAHLIVDAQSLTNATRLYKALGFHTAQTYIRYCRPVQP